MNIPAEHTLSVSVNIKEDSKSLQKALDILSKYVGGTSIWLKFMLFSHTEAEKRRKISLLEAQAKRDASLIESGFYKYDPRCGNILSNFEEARRLNDEVRIHEKKSKEDNVYTILSKALPHIIEKLENSQNEPSLDNEWGNRFFSFAKNICSERLQETWARILAGELSSPGCISLKTLNILYDISLKDATEFKELTNYVISNSFIWRDALPQYVDFEQILHFCDLGLMELVNKSYFIDLNIDKIVGEDIYTNVILGKKLIVFKISSKDLINFDPPLSENALENLKTHGDLNKRRHLEEKLGFFVLHKGHYDYISQQSHDESSRHFFLKLHRIIRLTKSGKELLGLNNEFNFPDDYLVAIANLVSHVGISTYITEKFYVENAVFRYQNEDLEYIAPDKDVQTRKNGAV